MKYASVILLPLILLACQSKQPLKQPTVAEQIQKENKDVRLLTRSKNAWHENSTWFNEEDWPKRWTKAHFEATSLFSQGSTILLGGCVRGETSTYRSALFTSKDGGASWEEAEPMSPGSCVEDLRSDGPGVFSGLVFWSTGDGAFKGYVVSRDEAHSWKGVPAPANFNPQPKIGIGSYSHLGHEINGDKFRVHLQGAGRAALFESRKGRDFRFVKLLSDRETEKREQSRLEQAKSDESSNRKFPILPDVWLDWESGQLSVKEPNENPARP